MRIIVLEGDETGQELLEQSLRVLDSEVLGVELELERFDLSLDSRRATDNAVVNDAAAAMREAGYGLKAATVTPEGTDDVGSPNRIVREGVNGKVIVRTGRRIPGVVGPVSGVFHPISVVRMAVEDDDLQRLRHRRRTIAALRRPRAARRGRARRSAPRVRR